MAFLAGKILASVQSVPERIWKAHECISQHCLPSAECPAQPKDHYSRLPLQTARLIENYGIEGDCKGGHPDRQINLMSQETLRELATEGFKTAPGQMGEQLIIDDLDRDLNTLPVGTRLQIGAQAVVELIKPRTGCERFEAIQGHPPAEAAQRLGVIARVVTGGSIQVGDQVQIL